MVKSVSDFLYDISYISMRALNEGSQIIGFEEENDCKEAKASRHRAGNGSELGSPSVNTRINCFEVKVRQWPTLEENRSKVSNNLALRLSAEKCVLHSMETRIASIARIGSIAQHNTPTVSTRSRPTSRPTLIYRNPSKTI